MQGINKSILLVLGLLALTAIGAAFASVNLPSLLGSTQQDYEQDELYARIQFVASSAANESFSRAAAFGIQTQDAGLHLLTPALNSRDDPFDDDTRFGTYSFWGVLTDIRDDDLTGNVPSPTGNYGIEVADVSIAPLIPNPLLAGDVAVIASVRYPGEYALEWNISDDAWGALQAAHGPFTSPNGFNDWTGAWIPSGEVATVMRATVVSDLKSYGTVNISALLAGGNPGSVVLADHLDFTTASTLSGFF